MEDWVFVDTCIWVSFFTRQNSREKLAVDDLLARDRVALVGSASTPAIRTSTASKVSNGFGLTDAESANGGVPHSTAIPLPPCHYFPTTRQPRNKERTHDRSP